MLTHSILVSTGICCPDVFYQKDMDMYVYNMPLVLDTSFFHLAFTVGRKKLLIPGALVIGLCFMDNEN